MLDVLDMAHPLVTLTALLVLLASLWMIHMLYQRLRVLENRLESLEQGQLQVDEELAVLSQVGLSMNTPAPSGSGLLAPPSRDEPAAAPPEGATAVG